MKDKQIACVMLVLVIVGCLYGISTMQSKLKEAQSNADEAESMAVGSRDQRVRASNNLTNLKKRSQDKISYYEVWRPHFAMTSTAGQAEEIIRSLVREGGLLSLNERIQPVKNGKDEIIPNVVRANLLFVDEYPKLFNWLGNVENAIPTSRVTKCEISRSQSNNDIRMELIIDIPLMNLGDESSASPIGSTSVSALMNK